MNVKVFAFQGPAFLFFGIHIRADQMELEIQDWLARNPRIKVHELKHDLVQHPFIAPQLVVSIYYTDAEV